MTIIDANGLPIHIGDQLKRLPPTSLAWRGTAMDGKEGQIFTVSDLVQRKFGVYLTLEGINFPSGGAMMWCGLGFEKV